MSETELSVVCKSCGAEVSPYVTECPYCGARVRKRAPDLERGGDGGFEAKQSRRERRREQKARQKAERRAKATAAVQSTTRPWGTIALIVVPAAALVVRIALGNSLAGFGGVVVPLESEWWRLVTAPFAYLSVGYLFAVSLAVAMFGSGVERRLGTVPAVILLLASGVLGTLAGAAVADLTDSVTVIAGGGGRSRPRPGRGRRRRDPASARRCAERRFPERAGRGTGRPGRRPDRRPLPGLT